jgi:hypothetical protein
MITLFLVFLVQYWFFVFGKDFWFFVYNMVTLFDRKIIFFIKICVFNILKINYGSNLVILNP